jgi:DNA-damage-inducible protein D
LSGEQTTNAPDFESIRHVEGEREYWSARELQPLLGYKSSWQNFELIIKKAKIACEKVGQPVEHQFNDAIKLIVAAKGAKRPLKDYHLTRFACYLIAQNGDPRKPEIAAAQSYFAISTRQNELAQLHQRLTIRQHIADSEKTLAQTAYNAGVPPTRFNEFQDKGYAGLYGDLVQAEIKDKKDISQEEELLDRMGEEELAANYFRITQTSRKIRQDNVQGEEKAGKTHYFVGSGIREFIENLGNELPENLPAEPSLQPLMQNKEPKRLKSSKPRKSE